MRNLNGLTAFVLSDQHYAPPDDEEGGVDPKAESCALQAIEVVKPDIFINIGDEGEWSSVSHWRYQRVKRPPLDYQLREVEQDAKAVNEGLDRWDAALAKVGCKEKHLLGGNHPEWLNHLCEEYPHLRKDYAPENILRLKQRGYQHHKYGQYLRLGKLAFYHGGHYTGVDHARKHVMNLGHSVMYGHYHDSQVAKVATLDSYHGAWSIGCIAKLRKPFLKGRPTNWSHNFAIVHFLEKGKFLVEVIEIYEGRCMVWGNKIEA